MLVMDIDPQRDNHPGPSTSKTSDHNIVNTVQEAFARVTSSQAGDVKYGKIVQELVFFICKDMWPFNVVEGEGFLCLMKELTPTFKAPGAKFLKKQTQDKYDACMAVCKSRLSKIDNFCITLDIWTETMNEVGFMGVTLHFQENGNMCMYYVATRALNERHTADYISKTLLDILNKYEIPLTKMHAAVTDNVSSMLAAIRATLGKKKTSFLFCPYYQLGS